MSWGRYGTSSRRTEPDHGPSLEGRNSGNYCARLGPPRPAAAVAPVLSTPLRAPVAEGQPPLLVSQHRVAVSTEWYCRVFRVTSARMAKAPQGSGRPLR